MKTLGIIGGFSPETTAEFYIKLIELSRKHWKNYPSIIIYNPPMLFELEKKMAGEGKNQDEMVNLLTKAAKKLEQSEVSMIVIPCNTVHLLLEKIQKKIKIPILNIINQTTKEIKELDLKTVGILATNLTIQSQLFQAALTKNKIETILPSIKKQHQINKIILRLLRGKKILKDKFYLLKIIKDLHNKGAEAVVLGCTDLQLLIKQQDTKICIIDSTDVLARKVFEKLTQ